MKDINLLSLDLELNQPSGTIIQVGAVVGNLASGEILAEYSAHIWTAEIINPTITQLTGIRQTDVLNGICLITAYRQLIQLHKDFNCFRNALVWGGGDSEYLKTQLEKSPSLPILHSAEGLKFYLFGRRWIDAKTLYVSRCFKTDVPYQGGLSKAMTKLGLQFKGKKHQACDDARNTFYIYRKLLEIM